MSTEQDFLAEVEAFLERHQMAPASLGSQALKDPKFVSDLRNGRSPSLKTIEKLRLWMQAHGEQGAPAAPPPVAERTASPMAGAGRGDKKRRRGTVPRVASSEIGGGGARRRGARGVRVVFWLVLLSGLAAGAYFFGPRAYRTVADLLAPPGQPPVGGAAPSSRMQSLDRRLQTLEARPAGGALAEREVARLDRRLDGLALRLSALEKRLTENPPAAASDQPANDRRIDALGRRLEALGKRLAARESGAGGEAGIAALRLVFALEEVRRAALSGEAFEAPLARLAAAVPATDPGLATAVERLHPFAARGIPLARRLGEDFATAAEPALAADSRSGQGWWRRLLGSLGRLVRIRATDSATAKGDAAIVMAAEEALGQGDPGAALKALDGLSAPAAGVETLLEWRARAARRLEALVLLDQLAAATDAALAKGLNGGDASDSPATEPPPGGRR